MTPADLAALTEFLCETSDDPEAFVLGAFAWGEGELTDYAGPEPWQLAILREIKSRLLTVDEAIRLAIASGHGVGKSALVAWLILWAISTMEDTRGVVTANTENQLKTKTWAELAKWFRLFIGKELFDLTATGLFSRDPDHEKTWRIDMVPWSERNTEAFAGLHNQGKRILVLFDEASAIPDIIHETTEGALTDKNTQIIWVMCGNPTRNSGRFREAFRSLKHRWTTHQVDSREVRFSNKSQITAWIQDYGDDSDFVRIRVKGEFPRTSSTQFIGTDLVESAAGRETPRTSKYDPLIIGVDVARFGDDASRISFRKGRDARSIPSVELRGIDTMELAARVADEAMRLRADMVFVDEGGVGGGVVDRLRQLRIKCIGIQFGSRSDRQVDEGGADKYANKRAEMYGMFRAWLKGGAIEDHQRLRDELAATEYTLNQRDEIQLERKEDLKKRLPSIGSPDWADSLVLTCAYPVASAWQSGGLDSDFTAPTLQHEYHPLENVA